MAVNPAAITSAQTTRTERRASRQQRRTQRLAAREAAKAAPPPVTDAAAVKLSTDSTKSDAAKTEPAKTDSPKSETKNFIGNTAGSNVVNFAVQGAAGGNKIAVFGSGSGPKAVKTDQDKSTESAEKVDTVA